mmetsp:Transcript_133019/g.384717  ORF Transcript_133019/g.384717 Transcript_133019/m.384717 type:complete len:210 (-) Transcript_133019:1050-1679(-)
MGTKASRPPTVEARRSLCRRSPSRSACSGAAATRWTWPKACTCSRSGPWPLRTRGRRSGTAPSWSAASPTDSGRRWARQRRRPSSCCQKASPPRRPPRPPSPAPQRPPGAAPAAPPPAPCRPWACGRSSSGGSGRGPARRTWPRSCPWMSGRCLASCSRCGTRCSTCRAMHAGRWRPCCACSGRSGSSRSGGPRCCGRPWRAPWASRRT